jgi:hypothetical protein
VLSKVIDGASAVGGMLPARVAHGIARVGGTLEWAARPAKRRVLAQNLGHALGLPPDDPDVRRLVRREVVNEAHRSADVLWALSHPDELRATTAIEGAHHIRDALSRGNGVILSSLPPGLGGRDRDPCGRRARADDGARGGRLAGGRSTGTVPQPGSAGCTRPPAWHAAAVLRRGHALLMLGDREQCDARASRPRPRRRSRPARRHGRALAPLRHPHRPLRRPARGAAQMAGHDRGACAGARPERRS